MSEHSGDRKRAIESIKERANFLHIARDVFGLTLRKAGTEYVCLCPFHDEKSPSFYINPVKGVYLCRAGCTPGGDIIRFVARMQGTSDGDAIKWLARHVGVDLPSAPRTAAQRAQGPKSRQQKTLNADQEKSLLVHAASFFIEQGRCSKEFAQFVASRKITTTSQSAFLLGYAPNDSVAFLKYLAEAVQCRPESPELLNSLERVGLWKKSVGAPFFRNRIMFPVADRAGSIVGFAGRKVNDEDPGPKYLNSPETPYFNKSQLLYGMQAFCGLDKEHAAEWALRARSGTAIVVEGYTDVIALSRLGIWAVAAMGTSFTESHLQQLRQRTSDGSIVFCFDGDRAGEAAALRTARMLLSHYKDGDQFLIQRLPADRDPDEMIRAGVTAEGWHDLPSEPLMSYWINGLLQTVDLDSIEGRVRAIQSMHETLELLGSAATITRELFEVEFRRIVEQAGEPKLNPGDVHPWVWLAIKACCNAPGELLGRADISDSLSHVAHCHPAFSPYPGIHEFVSVAHVISQLPEASDWYSVCGVLLAQGVPPEALIVWGRIAGAPSRSVPHVADILDQLPAIAEFCAVHGRLIVMTGGVD